MSGGQRFWLRSRSVSVEPVCRCARREPKAESRACAANWNFPRLLGGNSVSESVELSKTVLARTMLARGYETERQSQRWSSGTGKSAVASRADEYRRRAQRCLEIAGAFKDLEAWNALARMAEVWLRLADDWDDANDTLRQSIAAEKGQLAATANSAPNAS